MANMSDIGHNITHGSAASTGHLRGEEMFGVVFDGNVIRRFIEFVTPYRKTIYIAFVAVLIYTFTQIAIPLLIRDAVDSTVGKGKDGYDLLVLAVQIFFAVVTVNYISNYFQLTIVAKLAERILIDLRRAMFVHLQEVSLSFMDKTEVGRLMSRLQGDVNSIQEFLETSIFAIGDFILLIGIIVVLLTLDWQLGLLTLSVVPALFIVRMVWLPIAKKAFMRARETSSIVNGALAENINGVRTVQEMTRQSVNFGAYDEKAHDNLLAHLKAVKLAQIMVPTVDTLTGSAMAIVIIVGGNLVLKDSLDLGVMVAFLFYVQRFFDPIRSLTMQYSVMQRAMASGQRIFEVLDVKIEVEDKPDAEPIGETDGSVTFKDVTFGYLPDQPVLKNINFEIKPGETVALVGPTGSGKTSTTALLHRFYDIWEGEIRIGGKDIRDVTQDSLGDTVAMVLQEPFLFTGTVFENIRYHKLDATQQEVETAAKAVGAHDFIEKLSEGYNTILGQRGGSLSIGQRQLISFARAIVADAKILVLDEATANIDSFTERQIQEALAVMLEGRTGIVIAHRLATVRGADRIMVLQDGEIIETGNHDELMAMEGMYHRLYTLNYASFDDVPDELIKEALNFKS
ncbi:MAG: ABC transporter ATP-binding protein [Rhodospirillaceae bacterium]|nr:ABC transporter ATP-binding protein [Rhodospirillaceae bacterium]